MKAAADLNLIPHRREFERVVEPRNTWIEHSWFGLEKGEESADVTIFVGPFVVNQRCKR